MDENIGPIDLARAPNDLFIPVIVPFSSLLPILKRKQI